MAECMDRVSATVEPRTWAAFRLFSLDEVPAAEVGERLEMTVNAVYQAKRTVVRKLRAEADRLEST